MTQKTDPFINLNWGWDTGEGGWGEGMNENLIVHAFLQNKRIDGVIANASLLPASPTDGQAYFAEGDKAVYLRAEGTWYTLLPSVGMTFILKTTEEVVKYNGITLVSDTRSIEAIVGLQDELDDKVDLTSVGASNGVAPLGVDGKVPAGYLPASGSYLGTWDATTNTPTITSGSGASGEFYKVSVGGNVSIDGTNSWSIGDEIRFNGTVWQRVPNTSAVSSVNGEVGAVVLDYVDVGAAAASHTHAMVTTTVDGYMSAADKTKLNGIANGASANSSNATLLSRANHTGTQAQSTIVGLLTDLAAKQETLVSGTNIKTINGNSLLGSGDLVISGGGGGSSSFLGLTDTPSSYATKGLQVARVNAGETAIEFVAVGSAAFANTTDFANSSHTHANATTSLAGFMSATDKVKVDGIATGATANQVDSYLLNRTNHTGTQAQSTIVNLVTDLAAKQASLGYTPVNKAGDSMSGGLTLNGGLVVNDGVVVWTDTNSPAATMTQYISFRDQTNIEAAWIGFGAGNGELGFNNSGRYIRFLSPVVTNSAVTVTGVLQSNTQIKAVNTGSTTPTYDNNQLYIEAAGGNHPAIGFHSSGLYGGVLKLSTIGFSFLYSGGTSYIAVNTGSLNVNGQLNVTGESFSSRFIAGLASTTGILDNGFRVTDGSTYNYGMCVPAPTGGLDFHADQSGAGNFRWYSGSFASPTVKMILHTNTGNLELLAGTYSGNGSGLTTLSASNISTGTLADARLPTSQVGKTFTSSVSVIHTANDGLVLDKPSGSSIKFARSGVSGYLINDDSSGNLSFYANGTTVKFTITPSGTATFVNDIIASSFTGNGSNLNSLNASNLSSGTVNAARLPAASTSVAGIVQLDNSTSGSTSTTKAPTAAVFKNLSDNFDNLVATVEDQYNYPQQDYSLMGNVSGTVSPNTYHVLATAIGNCTWNFLVPSGAGAITLELTNGGAYTMTWPSGTRWAGGVAPINAATGLTASGTDILVFTKVAGNNWRGFLSAKDSK